MFIIKTKWLITTLLISWLAPTLLRAQQQELMIDINKDFIDKYGHFSDGKTFGKKSYYYRGPEPFETVSSPNFQANFRQGHKDLIVLPMEEKQFWIKVTFLNSTPMDQTIYLFSDFSFTRELSIYDQKLLRTMRHEDYLQKRILELPIKSNSNRTFYIKIQSYGSQRQSFTYWKNKDAVFDDIIQLKQNYGVVISIFFRQQKLLSSKNYNKQCDKYMITYT